MTDQADNQLQELLDDLDPQQRLLAAEFDLGLQALHFIPTELGKYLVGCAQQEYMEASYLLSKTAPWRRNRIQELQNQQWRAKSFLGWLSSLIVAGRSAEDALQAEE